MPLETRLLQLLSADTERKVVTERIPCHARGDRASSSRQALEQLVHRPRREVEHDPAAPRLVRTVPNAG